MPFNVHLEEHYYSNCTDESDELLFVLHACVPDRVVNNACLAYIILRLVYGAVYTFIKDDLWNQLRGVAWWVGGQYQLPYTAVFMRGDGIERLVTSLHLSEESGRGSRTTTGNV